MQEAHAHTKNQNPRLATGVIMTLSGGSGLGNRYAVLLDPILYQIDAERIVPCKIKRFLGAHAILDGRLKIVTA